MCKGCGRVIIPRHPTLHGVVDHIDPHRGDDQKFWDEENLQSLHKSCHDLKTRHEQYIRAGLDYGTAEDGWPLKVEHEKK